MRLTGVLVLLACGCGAPDSTRALSPATITAINYNMYFGIAADLVPEEVSPGTLSATTRALLNAIGLTEYKCRIDGAARVLAAEQPDVLGVQEAVYIAYARDLSDRGDDDVIVDFVDELVRALERESGVRYRAFVRENTVIEDRLPFFGGIRLIDRTAILVHPRFSGAKRAGSLTYQALEPASDFARTGTGQIIRGAIHVEVPLASGTLDIFSTHLQSGGDEQVRIAQAQELVAFIGASTTADSTIVLAGDLNDVPGSPTYQAVAAQLVDSYGLVGAPPGFTAYQTQTLTNPTDEATLRIDYVFARGAGVDESRVILNQQLPECGLWPSDHFAVVSRFRTNASPAPAQSSE